jgi:hypothetical protein
MNNTFKDSRDYRNTYGHMYDTDTYVLYMLYGYLYTIQEYIGVPIRCIIHTIFILVCLYRSIMSRMLTESVPIPRILVEQYAIPMRCIRCPRDWLYTGKNKHHACCPSCGSRLSIRKNCVRSEQPRAEAVKVEETAVVSK